MADHDDVRSQGGSLEVMATLVRDPQPVEFERLLERRRRLGKDLLDEVWDGVHHVNPAPHSRHSDIQQQLAVLLDQPARQAGLRPRLGIFNLGEPNDYRYRTEGYCGPVRTRSTCPPQRWPRPSRSSAPPAASGPAVRPSRPDPARVR